MWLKNSGLNGDSGWGRGFRGTIEEIPWGFEKDSAHKWLFDNVG